MLDTIKINVLYPLLGRAGTFLAANAVGWGVQQQHADWLALGVMGVGGLVFDLLISRFRQRLIVNKTFAETVEGILSGKVS